MVRQARKEAAKKLETPVIEPATASPPPFAKAQSLNYDDFLESPGPRARSRTVHMSLFAKEKPGHSPTSPFSDLPTIPQEKE